jgi:hypothetical protein
MSLAVDVEIELTDTAVRRCTQALIDCGTTGCFKDIEWAKLNNIPTRPLTNPIPVYNIDGTANDTGMITDMTDIVLRYDNHSERTQLAVCKGITQTLIPDTLAVKPKASQSTDGNLLWSVVYISDTACLHISAADDTQPALADPHPLRWPWPVTGGYATGVP